MPPTIRVIASLIANKKSLCYAVARAEDNLNFGPSFVHRQAGYPLLKFATINLGHGLVLAYTQHCQTTANLPATPVSCLVWVYEMRCHASCGIIGECQGETLEKEVLEKIEKKHLYWVDKLPTV